MTIRLPASASEELDAAMTLLAAVVRAYGQQESSDKGSRMIVDEYEIESARSIFLAGGVTVYQLEPGSMTSLERDSLRHAPMTNRFVIEVKE